MSPLQFLPKRIVASDQILPDCYWHAEFLGIVHAGRYSDQRLFTSVVFSECKSEIGNE